MVLYIDIVGKIIPKGLLLVIYIPIISFLTIIYKILNLKFVIESLALTNNFSSMWIEYQALFKLYLSLILTVPFLGSQFDQNPQAIWKSVFDLYCLALATTETTPINPRFGAFYSLSSAGPITQVKVTASQPVHGWNKIWYILSQCLNQSW